MRAAGGEVGGVGEADIEVVEARANGLGVGFDLRGEFLVLGRESGRVDEVVDGLERQLA